MTALERTPEREAVEPGELQVEELREGSFLAGQHANDKPAIVVPRIRSQALSSGIVTRPDETAPPRQHLYDILHRCICTTVLA